MTPEGIERIRLENAWRHNLHPVRQADDEAYNDELLALLERERVDRWLLTPAERSSTVADTEPDMGPIPGENGPYLLRDPRGLVPDSWVIVDPYDGRARWFDNESVAWEWWNKALEDTGHTPPIAPGLEGER